VCERIELQSGKFVSMGYHRKSPRFDVNFGSTFAGDVLAGQGAITNLSVGGCSIESQIPLPTQSVVGLKIQLPDSQWPLEVDQAVVRWVRGHTFGLEFQALSEPDTTRLQQLLQDLDQGPLVVMHRTAH
jgi:hypothetical protein